MRSLLTKIKTLFSGDGQKTNGDHYLKYLSNFVSPANENRKIGQDIAGIEEYEFDAGAGDQLYGHLLKNYARLHSGYFKKLGNDLKNSFTDSYTFYFSSENAKKNGVPENISIVLKQLQSMGFVNEFEDIRKMYNERVTPRVLDFFGVKTCYNEILTLNFLKRYVLSVYFIKPKESFYTAKLLNVKDGKELPVEQTYKIEDKLKELDLQLDNLTASIYQKYHKKPKINREQIKAEYVYSYLVRGVLVGDRDFNERNFGYIYNEKTNEVTFSPNFDFELAFDRNARSSRYVSENLEFVRAHYKEMFDAFIDRLKYFTMVEPDSGNPFYRVLLEQDIVEQEQLDYFNRVLKNNADYLLDYANGKVKQTAAEQTK